MVLAQSDKKFPAFYGTCKFTITYKESTVIFHFPKKNILKKLDHF